MGQGFLIDTNAAIYFLNNSLPPTGSIFISDAITANTSSLSFISEIELLAFTTVTASHLASCKTFISLLHVYHINQQLIDTTIEIRLQSRIKLPDAVIAATALVNNLTIITANERDFLRVPNLQLINPFLI